MFCQNNVASLPEFMSTNCPNWGGAAAPPAPRPVRLCAKFIALSSIPRAIEDVNQITDDGDRMVRVLALWRIASWFQIQKTDDAMAREYYNVRDEITITDDNILLRGKNVVIHSSLINQVVALAHEGRQSIFKTK